MQPARSGLLRIGLMCAAVALLAARPARGAFVGGVERFDGTVKDTVNWEQLTIGPEVISQNDALTITDLGGGQGGDYTTRAIALLPSSLVSAKVTLSATGVVSLFLTNNSAGTTKATVWDSYTSELDIWPTQIVPVVGGNGGGTQLAPVAQISNPVGQTFTLEIQRPNDKDYVYRAYNAQGTLLGTSNFVGSTSHPEALFISLAAVSHATVTWDDVTVNGSVIPEPLSSASALICLAPAIFARRPSRA